MKTFIAIVGFANNGKTTLIQGLTGCNGKGYRGYVSDSVTRRKIYVSASSLQEYPRPGPISAQRRWLITMLNRIKTDVDCQGMVMAIQPTKPRARVSMEEIINDVQSVGGIRIYVYVLDPARGGRAVRIHDIMQRLQPYKAQVIGLDARRFSLLNVEIINAATQIVR